MNLSSKDGKKQYKINTNHEKYDRKPHMND